MVEMGSGERGGLLSSIPRHHDVRLTSNLALSVNVYFGFLQIYIANPSGNRKGLKVFGKYF